MITILTDSTCDLSLEEANSLNVEMLSLKVTIDGVCYLDKRTITNYEFYDKLAAEKELPTTSLASVGEFIEFYNAHPEDIVILTISSDLSGTYHSALLAKEECERSNIYVVDSKTTTVGLAILVYRAVELRGRGMSAAEIAADLESLRERIRIVASLDTLRYLVKGGRLSVASGLVGSLLQIKPVICVKDGKIELLHRVRGTNQAIHRAAETIKHMDPDPDMPFLYLYSQHDRNLRVLKEELAIPSSYHDFTLGSVVGTHIGPGAAAAAFVLR